MNKTLAIGWDVAGWKESSSKNVFCVFVNGQFDSFHQKNPAAWLEMHQPPDFIKWMCGYTVSDFSKITIGIDAPLKYPAAFKQFVGETTWKGAVSDALLYRQCEIDISIRFKKWPLSSVGSQLGYGALLAQAVARNIPVRENIRIIEVYPGLLKANQYAHDIRQRVNAYFSTEQLVRNQKWGEIQRAFSLYNLSAQPSEKPQKSDWADALICAVFAQEYLAVWDDLQAVAHNPTSDAEGHIYYPGMQAP